jgi:proline iminopeptidase
MDGVSPKRKTEGEPMKKIVFIAALVILGIVAIAGLWLWNAMRQPLYEPGMARAGKNLSAPLTPPAQSAGPDFWTVENNIKLFHFADGAGTNVLVIHGGPGLPFTQPLPGLGSLTTNYRFYYYDQRGSGKSSRPIDRFTSSNYYENMQTLDRTLGIGAQIADIERIRQIIGDNKIILIGHSFGGFLAALYAAEFPEHVQALILVAPAEMLVMPPASGGLFAQVKPLLPAEMQKDYDAYLSRYLDYGSIFSKSEVELSALNAEFARYYAVAAKQKGFAIPSDTNLPAGGGWMVHAMYLSLGLQHDYRPAFKSINVPALVIHGENDLQPEQASRLYTEVFSNAEFKVIPQAGHFSFNDQPETFARGVSEFLGKVK